MMNGFKFSLPRNDRPRGERQFIHLDGTPLDITGSMRYVASPLVKTTVLTAAFTATAKTLLMASPQGRDLFFLTHACGDLGIDSLITMPLLYVLSRRDSELAIDTSGWKGKYPEFNHWISRFYQLAGATALNVSLIFPLAFFTMHYLEDAMKSAALDLAKLGMQSPIQELKGFLLSTATLAVPYAAMGFYAHRKLEKDEWSLTTPPASGSKKEVPEAKGSEARARISMTQHSEFAIG